MERSLLASVGSGWAHPTQLATCTLGEEGAAGLPCKLNVACTKARDEVGRAMQVNLHKCKEKRRQMNVGIATQETHISKKPSRSELAYCAASTNISNQAHPCIFLIIHSGHCMFTL